jgi:putative ABC transport system substrate-binding protein
MNGFTTINWLRIASVFLLILVSGMRPLQASDIQIVIVKSSDNSYFDQTIKTLISQLEIHSQFKVINSDKLNSSSEILQKSSIVITLGAGAANTVASQFLDQLVLNAYITDRQTGHFKNNNQSHIEVYLNQPLERYLAFSQLLLDLKTLGTINRTPLSLSDRQHKILKKLNLKLNQYHLVDTDKKLLAIVRQLTKKDQALLMLPDQTIFNRDTLKGLLLTTYHGRTPVISYSPGHVKSGALAAIYSSPTDIGRHLANIIDRYLEGSLDTSHRSVFAKYYSITTNQRVAHSLGLSLPSEQELRKLIDGLEK